jgi:hypothetical protein
MWQVWQSVAASFSAFDVNVTTNPAVYTGTTSANRGKAVFSSEDQISSCYMDSFGSDTYGCQIYTRDSTATNDGPMTVTAWVAPWLMSSAT